MNKDNTKDQTMKNLKAYCYRDGAICFGANVPDGALPIAQAPKEVLCEAIYGTCRMSHPAQHGGAYVPLVPGIPEAKDGPSAVDALIDYVKIVEKRIKKLSSKEVA